MSVPYSFDLLFLTDEAEPAKYAAPIAHVTVARYTRGGYKGHENSIMITPSCASFEEFEFNIQRLKKELDQISAKARKEFENLKNRS